MHVARAGDSSQGFSQPMSQTSQPQEIEKRASDKILKKKLSERPFRPQPQVSCHQPCMQLFFPFFHAIKLGFSLIFYVYMHVQLSLIVFPSLATMILLLA
jgi:hypothetical protein